MLILGRILLCLGVCILLAGWWRAIRKDEKCMFFFIVALFLNAIHTQISIYVGVGTTGWTSNVEFYISLVTIIHLVGFVLALFWLFSLNRSYRQDFTIKVCRNYIFQYTLVLYWNTNSEKWVGGRFIPADDFGAQNKRFGRRAAYVLAQEHSFMLEMKEGTTARSESVIERNYHEFQKGAGK